MRQSSFCAFQSWKRLSSRKSGADKPRFLTLSKSRPGGNPKVLNIIALGIAKLFLCFSKLEAKFFQREAVRTNQGYLRFLSQGQEVTQ
jgi:hypothetical protein